MAAHLDLEEQEQLEQLKAFWKRWGNAITWLLTLVLVAYAGWTGWNYWQRNEAAKAGAMFSELERAVQAGDLGKGAAVFGTLRQDFASTGYTAQAYLGMGDPYLFTSIAAVAIGGASILGGSGHYIGTIAGALVLTILTGLLPALNLSSGALLIVYGVVILVTVSLASDAVSGLSAFLPRFRRRQSPSA